MDRATETSLVIKEHNFQNAKDSLKKYTEQAKKKIEINKVPTDGGLFNLGNHTVKGAELNRITSEIQSYLINLNELNQGLVDEFGQVYKAFESLDKDYISGIVRSIQTAEKVSLDEQKDRADIKVLVQNLDIAVKALKKFKEDIEKLKHLMDVDAAYELIEKQEKLIKTLCNYKDELSALKHIKDVDKLWDAKESQTETLENINKKLGTIYEKIEYQSKAIAEFSTLAEESNQKYQSFVDITNKALNEKQAAIDRRFDGCERALQENFTDLRNSVIKVQEAQDKKIEDLSKFQAEKLSSIENTQADKLSQIAENQFAALVAMKKNQTDCLDQISNEQREMLAKISREQVEWLESTNKSLEEAQEAQDKKIEDLSKSQAEKLLSIENTQADKLSQIAETQSATLIAMKKVQADYFVQISNEQNETLTKISREQVEWLESTNKSLEEEKAFLKENITSLTQKVKTAYIVAGGAAVVTVVHMVLSILGVL